MASLPAMKVPRKKGNSQKTRAKIFEQHQCRMATLFALRNPLSQWQALTAFPRKRSALFVRRTLGQISPLCLGMHYCYTVYANRAMTQTPWALARVQDVPRKVPKIHLCVCLGTPVVIKTGCTRTSFSLGHPVACPSGKGTVL